MSELLNRSAPQVRPDSEQKYCPICSTRSKTNKPFAACTHTGSCVKCAEEQMIYCIRLKKYPTCFLDPECQAKMHQPGVDRKYISYYFTMESQQKWQKFCQDYENPEILHDHIKSQCKQPDCNGVIVNCRCTKCKVFYCEICKETSHPSNVECTKKNQMKISRLKQCPNCRTNYVRELGCHHVKCPKCHHEFCQICKNSWSVAHHACKLKLQTENNPKITESCQIF